ncbi:hypothetical protein PVAG01_07093 [Phlyctema vagabunda]|uniref:Uncharacterized protein n=1 Tax=Phlyctema vagabunda TaxID=108571 RepID=A0ABR4PBF9_9HELO
MGNTKAQEAEESPRLLNSWNDDGKRRAGPRRWKSASQASDEGLTVFYTAALGDQPPIPVNNPYTGVGLTPAPTGPPPTQESVPAWRRGGSGAYSNTRGGQEGPQVGGGLQVPDSGAYSSGMGNSEEYRSSGYRSPGAASGSYIPAAGYPSDMPAGEQYSGGNRTRSGTGLNRMMHRDWRTRSPSKREDSSELSFASGGDGDGQSSVYPTNMGNMWHEERKVVPPGSLRRGQIIWTSWHQDMPHRKWFRDRADDSRVRLGKYTHTIPNVIQTKMRKYLIVAVHVDYFVALPIYTRDGGGLNPFPPATIYDSDSEDGNENEIQNSKDNNNNNGQVESNKSTDPVEKKRKKMWDPYPEYYVMIRDEEDKNADPLRYPNYTSHDVIYVQGNQYRNRGNTGPMSPHAYIPLTQPVHFENSMPMLLLGRISQSDFTRVIRLMKWCLLAEGEVEAMPTAGPPEHFSEDIELLPDHLGRKKNRLPGISVDKLLARSSTAATQPASNVPADTPRNTRGSSGIIKSQQASTTTRLSQAVWNTGVGARLLQAALRYPLASTPKNHYLNRADYLKRINRGVVRKQTRSSVARKRVKFTQR